jgi:DNA repair protein RadC
MKQINSIKMWAEDDRPREKMKLKGRNVLSDAELLAIIIGSGNRHLSAVELSRQILSSVGNSLSKLSKLSIADLNKFKGIGEAKAISIMATLEIARRKGSEEQAPISKISSSKNVYDLLKPKFLDLSHEEFYVIYLDRANQVLKTEQISKGGISGTVADGKIIFQKALETKCSALILAHNHPSGQLKPSEADLKLTKSLINFGKYIDLQVLDHLIFSDNSYLSFADEGILN